MTEQHHDRNAAVSSGGGSPPVPLETTGVPGLDEVLGGGIQRGSLAILAGPPGSGKTILAHHIAFSAARSGRRTTILTAFSEPTNKLIAHMRSFDFFDQELLGQMLDVLSIQQSLRLGLDSAASDILDAVRSAKARLVVLDGFRGVRETAEHPEEARRFIYDVSNRLSLLGITLLLTSEANARDATFFPEATTADVLLGLAFDAIEARERRTLEVLKVRGAAPLTGRHALTIGDDGVTVYPRLEARVARLAGSYRSLHAPLASVTQPEQSPHTLSAEHGRARAVDAGVDMIADTGIAGLDTLLGGGFARGASALVVGERGTGKTLFGIQFALQGARAEEPGLFVSFRETEGELVRKVASFGWSAEFQHALGVGLLTILRTPPVELVADVLVNNLLSLLDATQARRLVLDEVGEIERALAASGYAWRFHDFLAALIEALRRRTVTTVFTAHLAATDRSTLERQLGPAGMLSQNLLWLRQAPHASGIHRSLTLQTPRSESAASPHTITIRAQEGIRVLETANLTRRVRRSTRMRGGATDTGIDAGAALRADAARWGVASDEEWPDEN